MKLPDNTWIDCNENDISGYINHDDVNPNCKMETFFYKKPKKYRVFISALNDIKKDTELVYNYFS